ncbi:spore gernimation protein GerQ [Paenibacillus sp. A3]|uniref:spore coat protein n=1 Tax=Paenibacillus sp. A3 TaxID=1337054 RepID=UPI0006D535BB|nr:spore coat protein [Paenibacillus sp. A3]KPV59715.1 spore gernimation protein GerQ [Paenibacillus sp. A3]
MNKDYLDPINAEGMPNLADSAIALDFLLAAKTDVRNCAIALSETATAEVRILLRRLLFEALDLHEDISQLMIRKGWLYPNRLNEQFKLDLTSAKTTMQIAEMQLFPKETSRLGLFATPEK